MKKIDYTFELVEQKLTVLKALKIMPWTTFTKQGAGDFFGTLIKRLNDDIKSGELSKEDHSQAVSLLSRLKAEHKKHK